MREREQGIGGGFREKPARPQGGASLGAIAALLLFALTGVARAEIDIAARVGFANRYKPGVWTPVHITLKNEVAPGQQPSTLASFEGRVELQTENDNGDLFTVSEQVDLPASSQKRVLLYAKLSDLRNKQATIRLKLPSGALLKTLTLDRSLGGWQPVMPAANANTVADTKLVVIVSDPSMTIPATLPHLLYFQDFEDARIPPADLPDSWIGLMGVDLLVIDGYRADAYHEAQVAAIRDWVRTGGRLLMLGGSHGEEYAGTPLEELLPGEILGSTEVSLAAGGSAAEPLLLTELKLREGARVLQRVEALSGGESLAEAELPLAAYHKFGMGEVHFWAFGSRLGREQQALLQALFRQRWDDLFERGWRYSFRQALNVGENQLLSFAGRPPNLLLILLLLGLYFVVVGPLNFRYLYKRRRMEWAWLTIPAIVLVFSIGMYLVGVLTMGRTSFHEEFHLVVGEMNAPAARQHTFSALFTPHSKYYRTVASGTTEALLPDAASHSWVPSTLARLTGILQVERRSGFGSPIPGNAPIGLGAGVDAPIPVGFDVQEDAAPMAIDRLLVEQWSWRLVEALGIAELGLEKGAMIRGDLALRGDSLSGALINGTTLPLTHAFVRWGNKAYVIGRLRAGEATRLELLKSTTITSIDALQYELTAATPAEGTSAASSAGQVAMERLLHQTLNTIAEVESATQFPRGRAFLYALVERPLYQGVEFVGSRNLFASHTLLVMHLPLTVETSGVLPPGLITAIPIRAEGVDPGEMPRLVIGAKGRDGAALVMGPGNLRFRLEAPFDPGVAFLWKGSIVSEISPIFSNESNLRMTGSYYDFADYRQASVSLSQVDAWSEKAGEAWMPAASNSAFVEVRCEVADPNRSRASEATISRFDAGGDFFAGPKR